ncbi:MAG: type II secretion system GspH family protein [Azoarcus sp.]|jgi:prepilin-type N-terminal cleavage/methylation domain-containing protein|nr:type II secretion system GspH family protein [Azoarcus sp.]
MNAIFPHFPKARARGFSLVEMSVALVIVGVLAFALWKIFPQLRTIDDARPAEAQIALADEAIQGFILKNHRLPCPDTNDDGKEDLSVSPSGPCAAARGGFPFQTLGVSLPSRLNYGAYQDSAPEKSLTVAQERHTPPLPPAPDPANDTEWPLLGGERSYTPVGPGGDYDSIPPEYGGNIDTGTVNPVKDLSSLEDVKFERADPGLGAGVTRLNGLDFCAALRNAQSASFSSTTLNSNGVNVAYVLAHPGAKDADGDGSFFDGLNAGATPAFAPPGEAASAAYDDQVLAVGFGELAARLSCTALLSRANAAGHMAVATFDHYRFALAHLQARAFLLDMAYLDLQSAYSGVAFSVLNVVSATAGAVMSTAAGTITAEEGVGAALLVAGAALGVATVAEAIAEVVTSVMGLNDAIEAAVEAGAARIEAEVHAHKMLIAAEETARYAVELDTKGLLP